MPGPIATQGSMHVCPMTTGTTPHVGGPITQGEPNIKINNKPAATQGSMCACVGPPDMVVQGAPNVFFNGKPVACVGDMTAHGGTITVGEPNVIVGSATPAPSVTMAVPKIPFPEITVVNRILGNTKKAQAKQNELREASESMEGQPRIYNLQWIKEEEVVLDYHVIREVTLRAYVENIPDGQTVSFNIKKPVKTTDDQGQTTESDEEVITLSGTVTDKMVEVIWEVEDATEENTTS